uniref:Uncharacterized protein n=1 Tax=Anguilla anguilla TaxID=7936 RepID=A0A0E9PMA2_ANGAN
MRSGIVSLNCSSRIKLQSPSKVITAEAEHQRLKCDNISCANSTYVYLSDFLQHSKTLAISFRNPL